ncbi:PEP/pyruvate-binding domain-containing protein [Microbispora hainanensis]|uniref:Pyruvate, phosphate dikinase n=1 Tax=Microbispora hainanensis TaxID=568844 RepID=A0A544YU55_9ACTN|nr:PEP/pyruvate-binding domain-containing protein [Microbispora hainanensis]TQS20283.1 pyruvate, phosphate dikinase [Microbispora hainanensis]
MLVPLRESAAGTCGGKAGALGALLRAGLPVPDGFVVPFAAYRDAVRDLDLGRPAGESDDAARRAIEARPVPLIDALGRALGRLGDPPVAVRSSAAKEDTGQASAAGQHDSFLAVHGADEVARAVRACWASLFSPRVIAYRAASGHDGHAFDDLLMAVIVQRHVDAEISGVMFTPARPGEATRIEASWGLGPSIVEGRVTPDAYRVAEDGSVTRTVADKRQRLDRRGTRLVVRDVPAAARSRPAIDDTTARRLAELGGQVAGALGGPQDIEWAIAGGRTWILQARPITAAPPPPAPLEPRAPVVLPYGASGIATAMLTGVPGSHGTVTGAARIVRGFGDFARVRPGDILVCPFTDPAWTPLLRIAAGVVTETGGVLSHAAIVAREHGIPAVLGVPGATSRLRDDAVITIDGTTGTVTAADA